MKKTILSFLIAVILASQAFAIEYMPTFTNSIKFYGIGVYFAPEQLFIYEKPDENSKIIEIIQWNNRGIFPAINKDLTPERSFVAFLPSQQKALYSVKEDVPGWCNIIFDQTNGKSGWTKTDNSAVFYTWKDFFNKFGRSKTLYAWKDTPKKDKVLRSGPDKKLEPNNNFVLPHRIIPQLVRGNWVLLKVVDVDHLSKIGWFQWRSEDGKLKLFPYLNRRD